MLDVVMVSGREASKVAATAESTELKLVEMLVLVMDMR